MTSSTPQAGIFYPASIILLTALQESCFTGQINGVPFGTWCPTAIIILAILTDFLSRRKLPTVIQTAWTALSAPFRHFITLDDVEGPFDNDIPKQAWIYRTLVSIALFSSFGWLAYFGYALFLQEAWTEPLVASIAWVGDLYILLHTPNSRYDFYRGSFIQP